MSYKSVVSLICFTERILNRKKLNAYPIVFCFSRYIPLSVYDSDCEKFSLKNHRVTKAIYLQRARLHIFRSENILQTKPGQVRISFPFRTAGKQAAFDVTVTSPLQSTSIFNAAEKAGVVLELAEEWKFNAHKAKWDEQDISLAPLAVEIFGGSVVDLKKISRNWPFHLTVRIFFFGWTISKLR